MTPPGHIRPWRLSCAVTALRAAFPGAKVHIRHYDPRAGFADFVVSQPVTITDVRELLSLKTSWAPRRLRLAAEVLNACEHEAAITALIAGVVSMMQRGTVIAVGPSGEHGADADPVTEVVALADSRFLFCDNNISDSLFEMRLKKTGALAVNWDDELVKGTLIAKDGAIVNAMIAERASAAPVSASKSGNGAETVAKKNGAAKRPAPKGGKT